MLADLDLLLTTVFCTADDLLPERAKNARRRLTDAEVVTLLVAQAVMDIASDRRFAKRARKQLGHLFPGLIGQSGFHKRRAGLVDQIEMVMAALARECPGYWDTLVVIDSTPVETARSRESSAPATRAWMTRSAMLPPTATAAAIAAGSTACACTRSLPRMAPRAPRCSLAPTGPNARSPCRCSRMRCTVARP